MSDDFSETLQRLYTQAITFRAKYNTDDRDLLILAPGEFIFECKMRLRADQLGRLRYDSLGVAGTPELRFCGWRVTHAAVDKPRVVLDNSV